MVAGWTAIIVLDEGAIWRPQSGCRGKEDVWKQSPLAGTNALPTGPCRKNMVKDWWEEEEAGYRGPPYSPDTSHLIQRSDGDPEK